MACVEFSTCRAAHHTKPLTTCLWLHLGHVVMCPNIVVSRDPVTLVKVSSHVLRRPERCLAVLISGTAWSLPNSLLTIHAGHRCQMGLHVSTNPSCLLEEDSGRGVKAGRGETNPGPRGKDCGGQFEVLTSCTISDGLCVKIKRGAGGAHTDTESQKIGLYLVFGVR